MRTLRQIESDFRMLDEREGRTNSFYDKSKMKPSKTIKVNGRSKAGYDDENIFGNKK